MKRSAQCSLSSASSLARSRGRAREGCADMSCSCCVQYREQRSRLSASTPRRSCCVTAVLVLTRGSLAIPSSLHTSSQADELCIVRPGQASPQDIAWRWGCTTYFQLHSLHMQRRTYGNHPCISVLASVFVDIAAQSVSTAMSPRHCCLVRTWALHWANVRVAIGVWVYGCTDGHVYLNRAVL